MIPEQMQELLLLDRVVYNSDKDDIPSTFKWNGRVYDNIRIVNRYKELMEKFLEPYVINSDSKE